MSDIGSRLRTLRKGAGLSQCNVAEILGVSQASVNRYENNQSEAQYSVLLWYADYFDVSMDYIFGRSEAPQGKLYDYKPHLENDELQQFVDMCFDPISPMNERLKDTLLRMLEAEGK